MKYRDIQGKWIILTKTVKKNNRYFSYAEIRSVSCSCLPPSN